MLRYSEDFTGIIASTSVSNPLGAEAELGVDRLEFRRSSMPNSGLLLWSGASSCWVQMANGLGLEDFSSTVMEAILWRCEWETVCESKVEVEVATI